MNSSIKLGDVWGCMGNVLAALIAGIVALIIAGRLFLPFLPVPPSQLPQPPFGTIKSVWVDYNAYENGIKGMRIHVTFNISHRSNITCSAVAYFWFASGEKLYDINGLYTAADGQVSVSQDFMPGFEHTTYSDLTLFMPITELYSGRGMYNLMFQVQLYDPLTHQHFATSEFLHFTLTNG